ncbi:MAG: hypothetical protein V8R80_01285 [Eubacterium sp.]
MRYPKFLPENGTIGFVAPSYGCNIEPYKTAFESALVTFESMGYHTELGPTVSRDAESESAIPRRSVGKSCRSIIAQRAMTF